MKKKFNDLKKEIEDQKEEISKVCAHSSPFFFELFS